MPEYTLIMNSEQVKEARKAIELLMRLKINQPREISEGVMPHDYWIEESDKLDTERFNDHIKRRDMANEYLEKAFRYIFPDWTDVRKDREWYVLYNLYQAIRYAIHEAEHPQTTGVDSYPPTDFGGVGLPKCEWRKQEGGSE